MISDYQWAAVRTLSPYFETVDWAECEVLYKEIEGILLNRFGVNAVLMPSGRASLAAILEFYGISLKHLVYAPRWSSQCVWDVIGRVSNPTVEMSTEVDLVIAVHKWGYQVQCDTDALIVEDSVDSIIQDRSSLFPLKGEFEVFSLPKLIGSFCGSVILTRNNVFRKYMREVRLENVELIKHQSKLKHKKFKGGLASIDSPEALEFKNRGLDLIALQHILDCLPLYDENLNTIVNRIYQLNEHFGYQILNPRIGRLPCLYPAKSGQFRVNDPALFMNRYFNYTYSLNNTSYSPSWLLPLHFGVSDECFEQMLLSLDLDIKASKFSK